MKAVRDFPSEKRLTRSFYENRASCSILRGASSGFGMRRGVPRARLVSLSLTILLGLLPGCYRVRVQSGLPPGETAPGQEDRWYHAFLLGLAEPQGPIQLSELCPGGWAELEEQSDFLTGAVAVGTLGLYTPHRLTIVCARPGSHVPAMFGYDSPRAEQTTYPASRAGDPPPPPLPQRPPSHRTAPSRRP